MNTPVYRLPVWFPLYLVLVCAIVLWFASCISTNKAATLGGAGVGAGVGAAVGGPLGAGIGGLAGAAGGDMLVDDPPTTVHNTNVDAQPGSTVHVAASKAETKAWYWDARWWVAAFLVWRFRSGLLAFARSIATGGIKASLLTLGGLVWGGKVAATAKAAVAQHEAQSPRARALRRLRRGPPAVVVSSEVKPHDA